MWFQKKVKCKSRAVTDKNLEVKGMNINNFIFHSMESTDNTLS